jgi:iron complex outermembrane recepter protein
MPSPSSKAATGGSRTLLRCASPLVLCALATAVLPLPALAQETLPTIFIRKPKPVRAAAPHDSGAQAQPGVGTGQAVAAPGAGVAGHNGTEIGPSANGQLCANGVCNDPKSYAAPIQSVGTKVNTAVMDTPVTTTTVTHQMLEDQQVVTLDQALRNVSGVTTSGGGNAAVGNSFSRIMIRGFPTQNYFRDGFRIDSFGVNFAGPGSVEMANVESVEVLKGPAAILYGAVEPGGIVNINTKQPLDRPAYSIQQQFGSYAAYRTSLDATGPLTQNKDLLYRFTMSYENDGSFRAFDYNRNLMFNPVVKWNVDADTWVRISDQYQQNSFNQDQYFIPYYNNVIPLWLGRSASWGPPSPYNQQQNFSEITWRHDFNKDWSIQQTAFMMNLRNDWQNLGGFTFVSDCITNPSYYCSPPTSSVLLNYSSYPSDNRQAEYATEVNLVGRFDTTEQINHTLLFGGDYYRYNFRGINQIPAYYGSVAMLGQPVAVPPLPYGLTPYNATEQYADNAGLYVQDQIKLPYGFNVLAGARYQYINNRTGASDNTNFCGLYSRNWNPQASSYIYNTGIPIPCNFDTITTRGQFVDQRVTPRFGLLWRPLEWISFYGNFAESYSPNYNGQLVYGVNQPTPPSFGKQVEGGVKLSLLYDKLQITADWYHLVKTNIPVGIPNNPNKVLLIGEGRSEGPELDIQGELLPGWNVNLAYANTDAITTKSVPGNLNLQPVGAPIPFVPRNVATLATSYEFKQGDLKGLKLGARYDYTGYLPFFPWANDGTYIYTAPTPSYGLVGVFGAYEFDYNGYKITTQLNVDNLFDHSYFVTGGLGPAPFNASKPNGYGQIFNPLTPGWSVNNYNFNVIGAPRTMRGSIKLAF